MTKKSKYPKAVVKVYHGYGHTGNLFLFGHVLKKKPFIQKHYTQNKLINFIHILKLFFVKPRQGSIVQLKWQHQVFETTTADDGFFKFEWQSEQEVAAGWHLVQVDLLNAERNEILSTGEGKLFIPHSTQYGFISDIDDTVLISHSGTTGKKLWAMLTKNPRSRKTFADVVTYYQLLSSAHTTVDVPNPFFYVSSSEWNLYDYLNEFFRYNELPKGAFLLNHIKKWYQLFQTGNTKHLGKFNRIERVLLAFPLQKFILLGDNSQCDPTIYKMIAEKYPHQVRAVYIRNIRSKNTELAQGILQSISNKNIAVLMYKHTTEAIAHSKSIGLIDDL